MCLNSTKKAFHKIRESRKCVLILPNYTIIFCRFPDLSVVENLTFMHEEFKIHGGAVRNLEISQCNVSDFAHVFIDYHHTEEIQHN